MVDSIVPLYSWHVRMHACAGLSFRDRLALSGRANGSNRLSGQPDGRLDAELRLFGDSATIFRAAVTDSSSRNANGEHSLPLGSIVNGQRLVREPRVCTLISAPGCRGLLTFSILNIHIFHSTRSCARRARARAVQTPWPISGI